MLPTVLTGWTKFHTDGTITEGNDHDVDMGRASWSRSPVDNIRSVKLSSIGKVLELAQAYIYCNHNGVFHQSDDFVVPILRSGTVKGQRVVRRIQRQLGPQDYSFMVSTPSPTGTAIMTAFKMGPEADLFIHIYSKEDAPAAIVNSSIYHIYHNVHEGNLGKWITIEIDKETNKVEWYLSDNLI